MVKKKNRKVSRVTHVTFGSVAGLVATAAVHPFDFMKVRLQLNSTAAGKNVLFNIVRRDGLGAFYTGLTAGLTRQVCYTTTRFGVYYYLYDQHKNLYKKSPTLSNKVRYGVCAAMFGAFVSCPADFLLVRIMADGHFRQTPQYNGLRDAFKKICCNEGVCTLWRGSCLTVTKAACFAVVQIPSYFHLNKLLKEHWLVSGFDLHVYASLMTSFLTATVTLPIDLVKTRYQAIDYKVSQFKVARQCFRENGVFGLWRGFTPYYTRLSCHTIISFYLYNLINKTYRNKFKKHKVRT